MHAVSAVVAGDAPFVTACGWVFADAESGVLLHSMSATLLPHAQAAAVLGANLCRTGRPERPGSFYVTGAPANP